jgi:hypothetical protein
MSSNPNKVSVLGAIIILATACTISVSAQSSAQSPASVNNLTVKPNPIHEVKETAVTKKSVPPAEGTDPIIGPEEVSEGRPGSEVPAPVRTHADTIVAGGAANEGPGASKRAASASPQTATTDEWQFQFSPYLWIAGISGQAGIGNLAVDVNSGITDSDVHLNFGFMGTLEARKNRWVILTDLQYSNLGTDRPTPRALFTEAQADFKTFILDPEVGYRVVDNPDKGAFVDVLGGIRYWHLRSDLTLTGGLLPAVSISKSRGWVDAVVGLRGKTQISKKWFITGKADVGGGGSQFTYQLFGGVGVMVSKKVALIGGYRDLKVNYDRDDFLFDMALHGPILGFGFKF